MKRNVDSNIPRYFAYTALKAFGFGLFMATWVIYLQRERGMSLSQAALVDVTFFVAAALAEIPTGVVADRFGRKLSMTTGTTLLCAGLFGWTLAPTLPLIIVAYVVMGVGMTFLSGAEDAFFYETLRTSGRADDYPRLLGRLGATVPGALALGSVSGGFLAELNLTLPFLIAGVFLLLALGVVVTLVEPEAEKGARAQTPASLAQMVRQVLALLHTRPTLRYSMLYLALVPLASFMVESVFVQPQALALGVPLAGIGVIIMAVHLTAMAGSAWSARVVGRLGEGRVLYTAPMAICLSLLLLAALQVLPSLLLIVVMGLVTAVVHPVLLARTQEALSDDIRATTLSMQSLTFTLVAALSQPTLGAVADHWGLPAAYVALAGALSLAMALLFWKSRGCFPQAAAPACPTQLLEPAAE